AVTGGVSFAGGPWNNYGTHAIATMANVLREDPGSLGLVPGVGGYLTKHALGIYSTDPPPDGFRWADAQDEAEPMARRDLAETVDGTATVESWVVLHGRNGEAERVLAACLLDDDRRARGSSGDADPVAARRNAPRQGVRG